MTWASTRNSAVAAAIWAAVCLALPAAGQTVRVWTGGSVTGDWFDGTKWTGNQYPQDGEAAVITNANAYVVLSNTTARLSSLTISNTATLLFTNHPVGSPIKLLATNVCVLASAKLKHSMNSDTNAADGWQVDGEIWVECTNLVLAGGAQINGDFAGFGGGDAVNTNGYGPGGGWGWGGTGDNNAGGGGYGGQAYNPAAPNGLPYGLTNAPSWPGSGGGYNKPIAGKQPGGYGGGYVRIDAGSGSVTVHGLITVNGSLNGSSSGGSGGGVYITCGSFGGTGAVSAMGGNGGYYNAGGGGRVAIGYSNGVNWSGTVSVAGGNYGGNYAQSGTLYVPDSRFLNPVMANQYFRLFGPASWAPGSLVMAGSKVYFQEAGFQLTVTNDVVIRNGSALGLATDGQTGLAMLTAGGDLTISNTAALTLYSGPTNGVAPGYGALLSARNLTMTNAATLYLYSHPTNGGSALVRVTNLAVLANAAINADGAGFAGGAPTNGWGPGRGDGFLGTGNHNSGGGGYGGHGGGDAGGFGLTYGDSNAPALPGSGGGGNNGDPSKYTGGRGGGLVRIEALGGVAQIDGQISANGVKVTSGSGGSGGGIYLRCGQFTGKGSLVANGGAEGYHNDGGGGRIAVTDWTLDTFVGTLTASAGGGYGATGTTLRLMTTVVGSWTLTVQADPAPHGSPAPYNYGSVIVNSGTVVTDTVVGAVIESDGIRYPCVGWSLTNALGLVDSGVTTQAVFTMSTNLFLTWRWTNQYQFVAAAGSNGHLQVDWSGWYMPGAVVTNSAVPDSGFAFLQWTGPGVPPGQNTNNPLTVTLDRNQTIQANFVSTGAPVTRTWTGAGSWFTTTNWNPPGVPGPGDAVLFTNGASTAVLDGDVTAGSLTVTNAFTGKLTFSNGIPAGLTVTGDLYLKSGATIETPWSSTSGNGAGRVITVGGQAVIAGTIDASGQGFPVGQGPGTGSGPYYVASHGGLGMDGASGPVYGSLTEPTSLGSGCSQVNGNGGGAVKLVVAGNLTLNGTVAANGRLGADRGGAGGSVWLVCNMFSGGGTVSANGVGGYSGGPGGGRVAIVYATSSFTGSVSVAGGAGGGSGQPGTLWEPGRLPLGAAGNPANVTVSTSYQYWFPDGTSRCWNLTLTNSGWVEFHGGSLEISNLAMYGATLRFDTNVAGAQAYAMTNLVIEGSILLTNSTLYLPSGSNVLSGDLSVLAGSTLVGWGNTNAVNADSGGTLAAPHGAGVAFVCRNATVQGVLAAQGQGFPIGKGPGYSGNLTASHGGGGWGAAAPCYGSLTRPSALGSGSWNGTGGGAWMLDVHGSLRVDGSVVADGSATSDRGGSGGSIWLVCDAFSGTGAVSAAGTGSYGGSGGGRVGIEFTSSTFTGGVNVNGGPGTSSGPGSTGTYFRCQSVRHGASSLGLDGLRLDSTFSLRSNDVLIARTVDRWDGRPRLQWTDSCTYLGGAVRTNLATYTLTGLAPGQKLNVYTNDLLLAKTNSDGTGILVFGLTLKAPLTVHVEALPAGTVVGIR